MELNQENKYCIISEKCYQPVLYSFKKRNPLLDIQIITKSDLLDMLSFSYQKDPIEYLLKKEKYDYSSCKKLLSILRIGEFEQIEEYKTIFEELSENGFIKKNALGPYQIRQRKILLFEEDEDYEITEFLKRNKLSFTFLHFSDLGRKPFYLPEKQPLIFEFDNKFQQFFYLFTDIRQRILKEESLRNNITILLKDDKDIFYVNFFSQLFHIDCFTNLQLPLISSKEVSTLTSLFFQKKSFHYEGEVQKNSPSEALFEIIRQYDLEHLDFSFAYSSLMEILSSKKINYIYHDRGINLSNNLFFEAEPETQLIYVTDFQYDIFYKEFDDNNLLPDDLLLKLKVNPSYIKTQLERRQKENFLFYHRFAFLSRVLLHLKDKIYTSQFQKEFNWTAQKTQSGYNQEGIYTSEAKRFLDSCLKDNAHQTKDDVYRSYDHSYTKIHRLSKKKTYWVTELDSYYECPFKYYLEKVLKIQKDSKDIDRFANRRGDLIHKVFEDIYTRDYSINPDIEFENAFKKGIAAYKQSAKDDGQPYTILDDVNIEFIHRWLKDVVKTILRQKDPSISRIVEEKAEQTIQYDISDGDKKYHLEGRIDKLIYTKGDQGIQYYTIVDYKSGSSGTFDIYQVFLGGSLQLPIYYLASLDASKNPEITHNKTDWFGGFGIEHLYFPNTVANSVGKYCSSDILNRYRLSGIAYNNMDYIRSFDSTAIKIDPKKGEILKTKGDFINLKNSFSSDLEDSSLLGEKEIKYTLNAFLGDAKNAILNSLNGIEENDFKISPTQTRKGKPSCSFCRYGNICYHAKSDIRDITKEISSRFEKEIDISDNSEEEESYSEETDE